MKFLEARRIVADFEGGPPLRFLLAASGVMDPINIYVQAAAAEQGFQAEVHSLPFGTLGQHVRGTPTDIREVFLLFPWDLCASIDWRSGVPARSVDIHEARAGAAEFMARICERANSTILYAPAPVPPVSTNTNHAKALGHWLTAEAVSAGATTLPAIAFSLESYCRSGSPFATEHLGNVARAIVSAASTRQGAGAKVLVTDFDNVLWHGVVGEDGPLAVHQLPDALGFPHFIYQSYLKTLRNAGVLLAGVTRNDDELALAPLRGDRSVIDEHDFVAVVASYNAKSAQIAELANSLNLGLDSFVFVDDNPVEVAEVRAALPEVRVVEFPTRISSLPALLDELSCIFHRDITTAEDAERTALYRTRAASVVPSEASGADLTQFLAGLEMRMTVHDRSRGDRTRAVQLINKTNQFNLNGLRRSADDVDAILADGGRLFTATLEDRNGSHGEILALLMDRDRIVRSFVLSCRVFQRRVEYAFLTWLASRDEWPSAFEYSRTDRNEPFRKFLDTADTGLSDGSGPAKVDEQEFLRRHAIALDLFDLVGPNLDMNA